MFSLSDNTIKNLKTIWDGALGSITFGAYHQFTTNKIMDINDKYAKIQNKRLEEKIQEIHLENKMLKIKINKPEKKWFNFIF